MRTGADVTRLARIAAAIAVVVALLSALSACGEGGGSDDAPTSTTSPAAQPLTPDERTRRETGTIVFEAGAGSGERLVAVDVDSWTERTLTSAPGFTPRLSPDGSLLAYTAPRPQDPEGVQNTVHVLSMVDGTDQVLGAGACPGWALDGTAVIVSRQDRLLRMALDGEVTPVPGGDGDGCAVEIGPGRYASWTQGPELTLIDHGRRSRLLQRPGCGIGPVAPDRSGKRLAMTITCEGRSDGLYVMEVASRRLTQVVDGPSHGATWSPADSMLATASEHVGDTYRLWWVCPCDAPDPLLIRQNGPVNNPTWAPTAVERDG